MTRDGKVCTFVDQYFLIPEGAQVGRPIKRMEFRTQFILSVYDNLHRTKRAYLSIDRKNVKSALIAAATLAHLVGPEANGTARYYEEPNQWIRHHWFLNFLKNDQVVA